MNTLLFTNSYLDGNSGGTYASRTHINLFAELSDAMTLVYPYQKGKEAKYILEEKVTMVPVEDHRSKIRKFLDLCFGKVHRFKIENYYLNPEKFDVVVFDGSVPSSGLIKKFKRAGLKIVTIHHNYQIEYLKGDGSRLTLLPNLFWTWIYEGQAVRNSDLNITLTTQDAELLKKHYCKTAKFGVLGVYEYVKRKEVIEQLPASPRGHRYAITGALSFKQTEDSLISWIKTYYPLLREMDPHSELTIAGREPSKRLESVIAQTDILLIPSPTDMRPILEMADYYICPTDCGGGLKLRIMDGLKYGLPVLTHKVSARGYENVEKKGLLFQYDNKDSFMEGIKKLNSVEYSKQNIRDIYHNEYSFEAGLERMSDLLKMI